MAEHQEQCKKRNKGSLLIHYIGFGAEGATVPARFGMVGPCFGTVLVLVWPSTPQQRNSPGQDKNAVEMGDRIVKIRKIVIIPGQSSRRDGNLPSGSWKGNGQKTF